MMFKLCVLVALTYIVTVNAQNNTVISKAVEFNPNNVPKQQLLNQNVTNCTEWKNTLGPKEHVVTLYSGVYLFDKTRKVNLREAKKSCVAKGFKIALFANSLDLEDFVANVPGNNDSYWYEMTVDLAKYIVGPRFMISPNNYCTYISNGTSLIENGDLTRFCRVENLFYFVCKVNAKFKGCK